MLLLVLASQLHPAHRRLGVRRRGVVSADLVLVPAETAVKAGIKAFVMNVIGDVGLVIAAFILFDRTGSLDYAGVFAKIVLALARRCLLPPFSLSSSSLLSLSLSSLLSLSLTLPPSPPSLSSLSLLSLPFSLSLSLSLLSLSSLSSFSPMAGPHHVLVAGSIALVVTDLKRVIAYSTMSQIGYMVLGVSSFAYTAGLFHLMTHAFFKALLFMGAGSVISAMGGVQNMDRMGGLPQGDAVHVHHVHDRRGGAGRPASVLGWLSKDAIIGNDLHHGGLYTVLGIGALVGVNAWTCSTISIPDYPAHWPP